MAKKKQPITPQNDEGDLLIAQVDEQLRNDRIVHFFTHHQKSIYAAILAFALAFGGYYGYTSWQTSEAAKRAESAAQARAALEQSQWDNARAGFSSLAQGKDYFAFEAQLALAKINTEQGNVDAALQTLQTLVANASFDRTMVDLARVSLFNLALENDKQDIAQAQLSALAGGAYAQILPELELALALKTEQGDALQARVESIMAQISDDQGAQYARASAIIKAAGLKLKSEQE